MTDVLKKKLRCRS